MPLLQDAFWVSMSMVIMAGLIQVRLTGNRLHLKPAPQTLVIHTQRMTPGEKALIGSAQRKGRFRSKPSP